jgi:hypothetical protein
MSLPVQDDPFWFLKHYFSHSPQSDKASDQLWRLENLLWLFARVQDAAVRYQWRREQLDTPAGQDAKRALHNAFLAFDRCIYPPEVIEPRGEAFRGSEEAADLLIGKPRSWTSLRSIVLGLLTDFEAIRSALTGGNLAGADGVVARVTSELQLLDTEVKNYRQWLADTGPPAPAEALAAAEPPRPRHGPDFRSVQWFGTVYNFTGAQAAVVGLLWETWENGTPEVGQAWLLEKAGLESKRLVEVFKVAGSELHPAWGSMIVQGSTKGAFRLQPPAA